MQDLEPFRRKIYFAITLIALGVVMNTTLHTSLGTVLIAVGGLFFIAGMSEKRKAEEIKEEDDELV